MREVGEREREKVEQKVREIGEREREKAKSRYVVF